MTRSMGNAIDKARELARHSDAGEAFIKVRKRTFRAVPATDVLHFAWDQHEDELSDGWKLSMKLTVGDAWCAQHPCDCPVCIGPEVQPA